MTNRKFALGVLTASALIVGLYSSAHADVISGSSSSYAEAVDLAVTPLGLPLLSITSGPLATASGTAPGSYSQSGSALSASVLGVLTTGLLDANASSNIDGSAGAKSASADATVNNLGITLLGALGITADTITSTSTVSGDDGALSTSGGATITNLRLNGAPVLTAGLLPNTPLLNLGGIEVILDAQSVSDTADSASISNDAIEILIDNAVAGLDLLNGSIVIAESEAEMAATPSNNATPVPEPGALLIVASGLFGVAFASRRKRAS